VRKRKDARKSKSSTKKLNESFSPKKEFADIIESELSENTNKVRDEYYNGCISPE